MKGRPAGPQRVWIVVTLMGLLFMLAVSAGVTVLATSLEAHPPSLTGR